MTDSARVFDGSRAKKIRQAKGLTQEFVASEFGVVRERLAQLENDHKGLSAGRMVDLAAILGVDPIELTGLDPDGLTLDDLRVLAGLNQTEVSDALGYSSATVWRRYVNAERDVPSEVRDRLGVLFGCGREVVDLAVDNSGAAGSR